MHLGVVVGTMMVNQELPAVGFSDVSLLTEIYPQMRNENVDYIFVGGSAVQLLMMADHISGVVK